MDEYVRNASSLPPHGQLHALVGIALILGLGKGGVPGLATVATAATVLTAPPSVPGGLGYAVALMVPILTMIDIYAAWLHRTSLDWPTVWLLLPTSFVGMAIGGVADRHMTDKGARLLVGIILLGILTLQTWKDAATFLFPNWAIEHQLSGDSREEKEERKGSMDGEEAEGLLNEMNKIKKGDEGGGGRDIEDGGGTMQQSTTIKGKKRGLSPAKKLLWAVIVGLVGGAATMLTNSMGPILNVYLLSVAELTPSSYVGTRAMFFCFLNLGKLPMRVMGGTLGRPMVPLATGLGVVAVAGVFFAKPIMLWMNPKTFARLELGVVAFAGLRLCYMGLAQ